MRALFAWCALLLACGGLLHCAEAAKARHLKWEVGHMFWSPDCEEKVLIGINGQFPGPTIRAKAGDTIVVELKNGLHTEGVVIHWHGIGTPWADGTAAISQCAINPEETFTYRFVVDKPGTYFYHGHYGMQRAAGLYGSLIVDVADGEEEPFKYDGELNLLLSDWYHDSIYNQMVGLSSSPMRWIGEPQSLLINGRGQFNCSLAAAHTPGTKQCTAGGNRHCAPVILPVQPNKTYRLRIASTTSLASLNLAIGNHKLTVVEADGNYVEPFVVDDMDIYSGDSYSVLLTTDQDPSSNYWVSIGVRGRAPKTAPALALLNYRPNRGFKLPAIAPPNANALQHNVSEVHPWHLHGHDFWVLGYGEGAYRGDAADAARLNLANPPLRNTAVIFPYGWTALRFVADNPGVWAFHCHIEPHLHMGMGVIFAEAIDRVGKVPKEAVSCGATATALMNGDHL
ncbi:L-ascorbate oxidase [Triticum urartu]|uniref:L-ascorbate oxidase n=2 Tax=Triticum TaxID=4564 RepID=A0A9R0ZJ64_TRITD|nr:L-ascorbate oxidase [Triticum urartu]VAI77616.1 unnamed protein product [Triticum turgidum subsp. durum]